MSDKILEQEIKFFQYHLYQWHQTVERNLPWKETNDPYKIWLSEIILQQTRVEQGRPYYEKFVAKYPTISDLANASEDEVLKLWQGLGYYSRARNLHFTAKQVVLNHDAVFPTEYKEVIALKGIGEYTAAAITSFAYGNPYAVVDGNVIRVLSRIFGIESSISDNATLKEIKALAQLLLDVSDPGRYNQAIMDFGALFCKPKNPNCEECAFQEKCFAYGNNKVSNIPFKSKKIKKQTQYLHYFLLKSGDKYYMTKRTNGIWQGLFQPFLTDIDRAKKLDTQEIKSILEEQNLGFVSLKSISNQYKHILTHKKLIARFYTIEVDGSEKYFHTIPAIRALAIPRLIDLFFEDGIFAED